MEPLEVVFRIGPLAITRTVITTWALMALLAGFAWRLGRSLSVDEPGLVQTAVEGAVLAVRDAIEAMLPGFGERLLPFIGTLWLFVCVANLAGLVPEVHSPTADVSATAGLALLVFASVHWFGVRSEGLRGYLRHYLRPSPILLPFHLVSEVTRTVALAVRLFGNMMSLEMAALLVLLVAGFLVPVPLLMLHIVEALVQAYIFGMLALVYIGGAIQVRQAAPDENQGEATT